MIPIIIYRSICSLQRSAPTFLGRLHCIDIPLISPVRPRLQLKQFGIETTLRHECTMAADLNDLPTVKNDNQIGRVPVEDKALVPAQSIGAADLDCAA